jgi:hypothetical protein
MIIRPVGPQDLEPLRDLCLRSILRRDGVPLLRYAVVLEDRSP